MTVTSGAWWGKAGASEHNCPPLLKSLLFSLFLFPNLGGLCVLVLITRLFPSLVECPPWNIMLQEHVDTELEASVLRSSTSYVFIFLLKKPKPSQLFLFLSLGIGRSHSRDSLANRSEGALKAAPWLPCMERGLLEWNLVLWKEEEDKEKGCVCWAGSSSSFDSLLSFTFVLTPTPTKAWVPRGFH